MLAGSLALLVAALFTGAALYVNLVEQPARLRLDDASLLAQWKLSYGRGVIMQASLSLIGFALSIVAGHQGSWLWFFGGIVLLANWPYTFLRVAPVNRKIKALCLGAPKVSSMRWWRNGDIFTRCARRWARSRVSSSCWQTLR
jgi:Domain of unknown function (DUF1772)